MAVKSQKLSGKKPLRAKIFRHFFKKRNNNRLVKLKN